MLIGGFLMRHLTAGVSDWELWAWMLVLGFGTGPAMAGFTASASSARAATSGSWILAARAGGMARSTNGSATFFATDGPMMLPPQP